MICNKEFFFFLPVFIYSAWSVRCVWICFETAFVERDGFSQTAGMSLQFQLSPVENRTKYRFRWIREKMPSDRKKRSCKGGIGEKLWSILHRHEDSLSEAVQIHRRAAGKAASPNDQPQSLLFLVLEFLLPDKFESPHCICF